MKWHDARIEPPQDDVSVVVKGRIGHGTYWFTKKEPWLWRHIEGYHERVADYPFYATVEEIEKELDSDE